MECTITCYLCSDKNLIWLTFQKWFLILQLCSNLFTMAVMQILTFIFILSSSLLKFSYSQDSSQPNIIFILADDLGEIFFHIFKMFGAKLIFWIYIKIKGWNDIGFHNEEVISPNINKLASEGIIFERNYAQPVCTPSRSALMTGIYPFKIGRSVSFITFFLNILSLMETLFKTYIYVKN